MAEITCPRCGGSREEPAGTPCGFCGGAGKVDVNEEELLAILRAQKKEQGKRKPKR